MNILKKYTEEVYVSNKIIMKLFFKKKAECTDSYIRLILLLKELSSDENQQACADNGTNHAADNSAEGNTDEAEQDACYEAAYDTENDILNPAALISHNDACDPTCYTTKDDAKNKIQNVSHTFSPFKKYFVYR